MGEQADLILNGDVCQVCGEEMGDGDGYPRSCSSCGGGDRQSKRANFEPNRTDYAVKQLEKLGLKTGQAVFLYLHEGAQAMYILVPKGRIDFWPFTGWFCGRKPIGNIKGRGIANLIKEIQKCLKQ